MLRLSANVSLLFRELPLPERFAAARAAGFPTVEIQNPYEHSAAALTSAARAAGVQVTLINAPLGNALMDEDPRSFRGQIERAAEYARALGTQQVNVLAGCTTPERRPAAVQRLTENLALSAGILGAAGARPLLEVINPVDVPGYCVTDFAAAAAILGASDPRVGLQFDVYHAAMLKLDPAATFLEYLPLIGHVQFADCPGRHEPGTGDLDFAAIFRTIRDSGYTGRLGAEYHPAAATGAGLGWMHAFGFQ